MYSILDVSELNKYGDHVEYHITDNKFLLLLFMLSV